ncbi:MAG: hypothetical protein MOB07_14585 [Acidobacteria bacterium]|nr:hypothetical protein [Acidobacteriota bacterium]
MKRLVILVLVCCAVVLQMTGARSVETKEPAASIAVEAGSRNDDRRLEGSWFGVATATSVPLPPLKTLITFTRDGNVIEAHRLFIADSPLGQLMLTPGHGTWDRTGDNEFAATFMVIYEGGPSHPTSSGVVLFIEKIRLKLRLSSDGNRLTGAVLDEIRDTDGNVIFVGPGIFEATRIALEPLP